MTADDTLSGRIEAIESGYEYLLAYAAQGRQHEQGSTVREALTAMYNALDGLGPLIRGAVGAAPSSGQYDVLAFLDAVEKDARTARGAIGLVLGRAAISSLLVDNLNASVHLRALLTDLFLVGQALRIKNGA